MGLELLAELLEEHPQLLLLLLELAQLVLLATEQLHYDQSLQIHLHQQPSKSA
jgi:hypothetical protein